MIFLPFYPLHIASVTAVLLMLPTSILSQNNLTGPSTQSCAKCDEVAPGFASLNGGTTGGKGGRIITVRTHEQLKTAAALPGPVIIRIDGVLQSQPKGFEVPVSSHKTIIGVGAKSGLVGGGFNIKDQKNIIIRNLQVSGTYNPEDYLGKLNDFDALQVDNSTNFWVDYVHFSQMEDGLIDLRTDTDYVTISRSILSTHNKALGIGWTQNVVTKVTINDCFFNSTNTRNPSAGNVKHGHLYNNYFRNVTQYGIYSRGNTSLLVENTYFEDVFDPLVSSPEAAIKSNWLKFKNCKGEIHSNVRPETVFNAANFYNYTLRDPYDIPIDIPFFGGPRAEIGI